MAIPVEGSPPGAQPGKLARFDRKSSVADWAKYQCSGVALFDDVLGHLPRLSPQSEGPNELEPNPETESKKRIAGQENPHGASGREATKQNGVEEGGKNRGVR